MATVLDIFAFAVAADPLPNERYIAAQRRINAARTGKKFVETKGDVLEYRADITVSFPQPEDSSKVLGDLIDFVDDHKALSFLAMAQGSQSLRQETTLLSSDGIKTVFAFTHKHLDASSVKVFLDDVLVDAGDYTLSGNNTAPIVTFSVAPATGTIKLVANFYVPCHFAGEPLNDGEGITDNKKDLDDDMPQAHSFELMEIEPGARFVTATGMTGA